MPASGKRSSYYMEKGSMKKYMLVIVPFSLLSSGNLVKYHLFASFIKVGWGGGWREERGKEESRQFYNMFFFSPASSRLFSAF